MLKETGRMFFYLYVVISLSLLPIEFCYGLRIFTSKTYNIQSLNQRGLDTTTTSELTFQVVACSDVHVAFFDSFFGYETPRYELVIGGWSNTKSQFRQGVKSFIDLNHTPLDCCTFHPFWVSWYWGRLKAGNGYEVGRDVFLELTNTNMGRIIKVGITTGWGYTGVWALSLNNVPLRANDFEVDGYVECPTNTVVYYLPHEETSSIRPSDSSASSFSSLASNPINSDISITSSATRPTSFASSDISMPETYSWGPSSVLSAKVSEAMDESRSDDNSFGSNTVGEPMTASANPLQPEASGPGSSETPRLTETSEELDVSAPSGALEASRWASEFERSTPSGALEASRLALEFEASTSASTFEGSTSAEAETLDVSATSVAVQSSEPPGILATSGTSDYPTSNSVASNIDDLEASMSDVGSGYQPTSDRPLEITSDTHDLNEPSMTAPATEASPGELFTSGGISIKPHHSTIKTSESDEMATARGYTSDMISGENGLTNSLTYTSASKIPTTPVAPPSVDTTPDPNNNCEGCPCDWPLYGLINLTLSEKIERIRRTLTLVKSDLSAARRRLTSAHDIRPSSKYMGASGATILALVFGIIVLADVQRILAFLSPTRRSAQTFFLER